MGSLSNASLSVVAGLPIHVSHKLRNKYDVIIREHIKSLADIGNTSEKVCSPAEMVYQACKVLLGDRCIGESSQMYQKQQQKNWSQTCWLPAACFLALENTVEVALAMRLITYLECPFSIRSAGHNANPGFSSIDGRGAILDLSAIHQICLSDDKRVVSVGPGATWGDVYAQLEDNNLTVTGGRVADVGVGGLITGGGMSHFSNHWGFACDNVKNFEVVTADSRVVYANVDENAGLYRALKGTGSNFGVVTRFDLYTHPDSHIWWNIQKFTAKSMTSVLEATVNTQKAMEEDSNLGYFLTVYPEFFIAGLMFKGAIPPERQFREFDAIEPKEILVPKSSTTYSSSARALSMSVPMRREIGTLSIRINAELYYECHRILQDISAVNKLAVKSVSLYFSLQTIGITAVHTAEAHGGNLLGLVPESQTWLAAIAEWRDEGNDDVARYGIRSFIERAQAAASSRSLLLDTCYMNDASILQSPWKGYRKESFVQLEEAAKAFFCPLASN
ncbi:FAD-binding domain-containing protein [Penicillium sp. IBT 35674x]|nr:FAD-binding domain-containing protein [Penicillium sp. IBT 35674x]